LNFSLLNDSELEEDNKNLDLNLSKSMFDGQFSIKDLDEETLELEPTFMFDLIEILKDKENNKFIQCVESKYKVNLKKYLFIIFNLLVFLLETQA
jgi:hypothetical protein